MLGNRKLIELADRALEAYNKQNLEEFCSCFSPKIEVVDLSGRRPSMKGIEEFREAYEQIFSRFPESRITVLARFFQGEFLFDQEEISGRGPHPVHNTTAYHIEDDLIRRVWLFW